MGQVGVGQVGVGSTGLPIPEDTHVAETIVAACTEQPAAAVQRAEPLRQQSHLSALAIWM